MKNLLNLRFEGGNRLPNLARCAKWAGVDFKRISASYFKCR
jgi:hypothetical protein